VTATLELVAAVTRWADPCRRALSVLVRSRVTFALAALISVLVEA